MNRRTAIIATSAVFVLVGGTGTAVALAGGSATDQPAQVEHPAASDTSGPATQVGQSPVSGNPPTLSVASDPTTEPTEPPTTTPDSSTEPSDETPSTTTPETDTDPETDPEDTPPAATTPSSPSRDDSGSGEGTGTGSGRPD
jgi:hypothetical protein